MMLSQETRMGALGGKAEVAKPGGEMDRWVGRCLLGGLTELNCIFRSPGTWREGWEGRGREGSGVEQRSAEDEAQCHSACWTS